MKLFSFIVSLFLFHAAYANDLKVDGDISEVVVSDSWKDDIFRTDVSAQFRYRAIQYNPLDSESGGRLVVEKLQHEAMGSPYKVHFSENIELRPTKTMNDELKKKNFESAIGCCHARNLKWDGFKLTYTVTITNTYKCEIENVNKSRKPVCRKVETPTS